MKKEIKETTDVEKERDKRRLLRTGGILVVALALLIGFTYAWFINRNDMATLMEVREPSDISILGPDGKRLDSLDLSYGADDKDENGKVTVRKVFCVRSASDYKLEIVHTTNLKGLTFTLYPAMKVANDTGNVITDSGISFNYENSAIGGTYINLKNLEDSQYKYANKSKHQQNYQNYDNVQAHAEPVYWLTDEVQTVPKAGSNAEGETEKEGEKTYYLNYYVCEITWTETTKETDIFYILAKNA